MAVKEKDTAETPVVTKISAKDPATPAKKEQSRSSAAKTSVSMKRSGTNPLRLIARIFGSIGGYFKGAWYELRQVRWPNRRATWGMTGALLGFTAFFVVFILLIDALFEYLFKLVLG